eukprot:COSAG01_NODE_7936_length_2984_cov_628.548354_2_plen_228_part_00
MCPHDIMPLPRPSPPACSAAYALSSSGNVYGEEGIHCLKKTPSLYKRGRFCCLHRGHQHLLYLAKSHAAVAMGTTNAQQRLYAGRSNGGKKNQGVSVPGRGGPGKKRAKRTCNTPKCQDPNCRGGYDKAAWLAGASERDKKHEGNKRADAGMSQPKAKKARFRKGGTNAKGGANAHPKRRGENIDEQRTRLLLAGYVGADILSLSCKQVEEQLDKLGKRRRFTIKVP